jgi:predicted nucleic acid-binding protein
VSELLVVDASVALKWVLPEADSDVALGLIGRHRLTAPDLLAVEAGNALWLRVRRRELTSVEARTALVDLLGAPVDYVADRPLARAALSLAADLGHPAYDCVYLALAMDRAGIVVTADRRFAAAVAAHPYLVGRVRLLGEAS